MFFGEIIQNVVSVATRGNHQLSEQYASCSVQPSLSRDIMESNASANTEMLSKIDRVSAFEFKHIHKLCSNKSS